MQLQQELSKQLLLFKNKKLFYIITAFTQNVSKKTFDVLNFNQKFLKSNTVEIFQQNLNFDVWQIENFHQFQSNEFKQQLLIESKFNRQQVGLIEKTFFQKVSLSNIESDLETCNINDLAKQALDYVDNIEFYQNGIVYNQSQYLSIVSKPTNDLQVVNHKKNDFRLSDTFSYKINDLNYVKQQKLFDDNQNYLSLTKDENNQLLVLKNNYKLKLYIASDYITDIQNNLLNEQFAKDIIFHACQRGNVYLKLYDSNDNFIKSFKLKRTTQFDFSINNSEDKPITFDDDKMQFYLQKNIGQLEENSQGNCYMYLQGRNIYHGNSICETVFCNFYDKNKILHQDIKYKILSFNNVTIKNGIWFNGVGYIFVRLYLNKLSYIKQIVPQFGLKTDCYSIVYRASTDQNAIKFVSYKNFRNENSHENNNNGFYCSVLDVKINYNNSTVCKLERLKIQLYNLQKDDIFKTNRSVLNYQKKIFLNKKNIIECAFDSNGNNNYKYGDSAIQQHSQYLSGYNTKSFFQLENINVFGQNDCIQVDNEQQLGSISFGLTENALVDIQHTSNVFNYIYLQYKIEHKKPKTLFDFKNFSVFNTKTNFPKKLIVTIKKNNFDVIPQLVFKYSESVVDKNTKSFQQIWKCNSENYQNSYFIIMKKFVANDQQSQISNWENITSLTIRNNNTTIFNQSGNVQNVMTFIQNNNSNGFKLVFRDVNYGEYQCLLSKPEFEYPKIQIQTSAYNNPTPMYWQSVLSNQIAWQTYDNIKRNVKIKIKDGQNTHVRLYTIVLQNHDISEPEQFVIDHQQQENFDLSGNTIVISSDSSNDSDNSSYNQSILYINNNFYNLIYSVNYFYSSQKDGLMLQSNKTYFDKSKYQFFNKSNLHIEWEQNDLFQYLILFDRFDNSKGNDLLKYKEYFLPFYKYFSEKSSDFQYYSEIDCDNNMYQIILQYNFSKIEIVLSFSPSIKDILPINVKYDYYYSYSNDYKTWTQYKYYSPISSFYAKHVRIKCCVYSSDILYCNYVKNSTLNYVDSEFYYLSNQSCFQSSYQMDLEENTKYMFLLRKLYNGQSIDTKLKLFQIGEASFLNKIDKLYVDGILCDDNQIVISGRDNVCTLGFELNQLPIQFNVILYQLHEENRYCVKQFYVNIDKNANITETCQIPVVLRFIKDENVNIQNQIKTILFKRGNLYEINCQLPFYENCVSKSFGYKIRYFNNHYQVSRFSQIVRFKFNSIPTTPQQLDVDKG